MKETVSPLKALNYIEDGGEVLVTFPGYFSSVFRLATDPTKGIERGNSEVGMCDGMGRGEAYLHFRDMIEQGGALVLL